MPDEWITQNRPGAFQHASFGKRDGWFLAIQMALLGATIANALAVLPPLSHGQEAVGGGLSRNAAIGVLGYGFWLFGLMGFKRWAIRILPVMAGLLLASGLVVLVLPMFLPPVLLPGDAPAIGWFSRAAGGVSAVLGGVALWLMRGARFREYFLQAWRA
jgi:hypothetical protein